MCASEPQVPHAAQNFDWDNPLQTGIIPYKVSYVTKEQAVHKLWPPLVAEKIKNMDFLTIYYKWWGQSWVLETKS